ncbi:MAG: hypothetical protein C5B43_01320 [Verrucomicrobia bacterium]|nr:MAG: hypothetical protein C5B43_01320 [Verrucomicrobiota bacterium]
MIMTLVTKPTVLPVWAVQDQVDPISLQNNVLTPPPEMQQYGWIKGQFPPRNWFNWLGRYTYQCLAWLFQQEAQSVVVTAASGSDSGNIFDVVNGGMAFLNVVDPANATYYYQGIVYIPPGYSSGTLNFNTTSSNTLTVSALTPTGSVVVSGGGANLVIYAQMKNVP